MALMTNTPARHFGLADRITAVFAAFGETYTTYRLFRRTQTELSALSDRELADLGLHRGEIERVALRAAYGLDN